MSLADERHWLKESQLFLQRGRDLRVRLLELYLLFVGTVLLVAFVLLTQVRERLAETLAAADLALVQAAVVPLEAQLAEAQFADQAALLALIEVLAERSLALTIVSAEGQILFQAYAAYEVPAAPAWRSWERNYVGQALQSDSGVLTLADPTGAEWLVAHELVPATGHQIIALRRADTAFAVIDNLRQGLVLAIVLYLVGGAFFWWALSRLVITPLEFFEAFSGVVRWRGRIRAEEQQVLTTLAERQDQVGNLARSLMAMEQDIEARFVQLSTLLETSRIVASTLDVTEVIDNILEQVQQLFHVERCAVVALEARSQLFRIRASRGLSADYVRQLRIAPTEPNSMSMRALRNQMPVQVSDTEADLSYAPFRPRARAEGFRSILAIPLLTQHAPPAVLILYRSEPHRYSYGELELASSFGHHASIAMENAALYNLTDERLQEQTRRLEAIVESMQDGLVLESMSGELLYGNEPAAAWVDLAREEMLALPREALMRRLLAHAAEPDAAWARYQAALPAAGVRTLDFALQPPGQPPLDLRLHLFDVADAQGEAIGRGQLWQDVSSDKTLDRMKSALLSTVSHELRTPLAAIKGYASTLLAEDVNWDRTAQREFLQTISDESDRLALMVKNLLDLSRIESGTLAMHCGRFALVDLLDRALPRSVPELGPRLSVALPAGLPLVWVDPSRIETVLRNLIENAVKYAPADSPIRVLAESRGDRVEVAVCDNGPGIPPELHERVFERFFRADAGLTRSAGGAGLGLAICKGFVEAHGGHIWVKPAAAGTTIAFTLPVSDEQ